MTRAEQKALLERLAQIKDHALLLALARDLMHALEVRDEVNLTALDPALSDLYNTQGVLMRWREEFPA